MIPEEWRGINPQVKPFQRGLFDMSAHRQQNPMATRNSTKDEMCIIQVAMVNAFSGSGWGCRMRSGGDDDATASFVDSVIQGEGKSINPPKYGV